MRGVLKWTGIGCGCLFGLVLALTGLLIIVGVFGASTSTTTTAPTPTAVVAAKLAATVVPTVAPTATTAQPTVTAILPTAVPATAAPPPPAPPNPAEAPKPEPKPSGPSPEAQAYLDWLVPKTQLASQSLQGLATQSDLLGRNPRLLTDNDWILRTPNRTPAVGS
jgi:hypothetical protein